MRRVQGKLYLLRAAVAGVVVLAICIALANEGSQILFWNYLSMVLRGCGVFVPLTLAIFLPHALPPFWAVASMLLSVLSAVAAGLLGLSVSPVFIGLGVSAALVLLGLLSGRRRRQEITVA